MIPARHDYSGAIGLLFLVGLLSTLCLLYYFFA